MIHYKKDITKANLSLELDDIKRRGGVDSIEDLLYFPKYFQIETTRNCNARCTFCPVDVWDKTEPYMSEDLFSKIVNEMKDYAHWIEVVAVQRAGEPLMDKKIVDKVARLKEIGIKNVNMATNASLLTTEKILGLFDAGIDEILLSIDSVNKESYEKQRVKLKYDQVMSNIKNLFQLRELKKYNKLKIRVRGVSFYNLDEADNRKELEMWENFWDSIKRPDDRIYMKRAHNWGNQMSLGDDLGGDLANTNVYHPCVLPFTTMHVTAMGIVPLCPQDYDAKMNIGNIKENSIKQVWADLNWKKIREMHATGQRNKISFCNGCRLFDEDFHMEGWKQKRLNSNNNNIIDHTLGLSEG